MRVDVPVPSELPSKRHSGSANLAILGSVERDVPHAQTARLGSLADLALEGGLTKSLEDGTRQQVKTAKRG